jgi:hypothetical protein
VTRPEVSVVVPARDEGAHVREHLGRIVEEMERLGRPFEVLVVDDGSRDATRAEAEAAARDDPRVRVLVHPENRGKGAALATGCAAAAGDVLVFLDADLEVAPDQIGPVLALVEPGGADVAVASKYHPASTRRRPWRRRALSRIYQAVTAVLFRLPIRDTQTGLKALRAGTARAVVPAIRGRRYAWDIELLLLAHRLGARLASGPVSVDFLDRGVRIPWRGFLAAGADTVAAFVRDRWFSGYAAALRPHRPPRRLRRTRAILSADDLGLAPSVDRACLLALGEGRATSVSFLAAGPAARAAATPLSALGARADAGVHLVLPRGSVARFLLRSLLGLERRSDVRRSVREQVLSARGMGVEPTHLDAHRHAFFPPTAYRAVLAEARALGVGSVRLPRPLVVPRCGAGLAGLLKGAVLAAASPFLRPLPRRFGLAAPDGIVDADLAERWVDAGRLPSSLRGKTFEVVAHPGEEGAADVPIPDQGLDRPGDARRLARLRTGLESLGVSVVGFRALERPRSGAAALPRRGR